MATILSAECKPITMQTQYVVLYMTRQMVSADTFDLPIVSLDSLEESLLTNQVMSLDTELQ